MTTPIVCGVDRSEHSRAAADLASALADRVGLPLLLVHVAPWPSVDPQTRRKPMGLESAMSDQRRHHERWLDDLASKLATSRVSTRVEVGPVVDWIVATAAQCSAALLVVGCRGIGSPRSHALGSVSADLTRRAPCPVIIVPATAARAQGDPLAGGRIVCGVGGRQDVAVARLAARLAEGLGLRLTLIHVMPQRGGAAASDAVEVTDGLPSRLLSDVLGDLEQRQPGNAHDRALRLVPDEVELRVRRGDVSQQISALAVSEHAALIVVGSRGRGPLRSGLLGSVSWHLAADARRPVMICRRGLSTHQPPLQISAER